MSKRVLGLSYAVFGIFIIACDQISKWFALSLFQTESHAVFPWLTFRLVFNRGISWGMFSSPRQLTFWIVTGIVIAVTSVIAIMAYKGFLKKQSIVGELFVLSGSISNLIDRFAHHAVIDFIEVSYKNWMWPVFNISDCFIVIGVIFIFINQYKRS